jgi:CheY-like chemotaxis protein
MIEDNAADVRLMQEAFKINKIDGLLRIVRDGIDAMAFLRQQGAFALAAKPDIIFLDLNLPKRDGREVLQEIKRDAKLRRIPVVVLSTSRDESDIAMTYDLNANCYIVKPPDVNEFFEAVRSTGQFWLNTVTRASR